MSVGLISISFPPVSFEEKQDHPIWQGPSITLTPGSHTCIRGFGAGGDEFSKQSSRINETKDILKVTLTAFMPPAALLFRCLPLLR